MGQKNFKGVVSVANADGRIRLRWRYQAHRYSLSLYKYSKQNLLQAKKTALQIEQDMLNEQFDYSLNKYRGVQDISPRTEKTITEFFEEWTTVYRQMDCEKNVHYNAMRNTMKRWGQFNEKTALLKLNQETFGARTYNERLTMLKSFAGWLVKAQIWSHNPFADVNRKKVKKAKNPTRKPFTEEEISKILNAIRYDTFSPKSSRYKHSHYYPFVYFIFKTGVRNAEAIGLRVGSVNVVNKTIAIKEVMARSLVSTSSAQRIRKETKNGKERYLPLTADLHFILHPLIVGRDKDALVFESPTGLAIDDHNFQRRIFKNVLAKLGIEERVLYACRHTFGSRCIDAGITPVMTAFLMGNNPETALRNYTHQLNIPTELPEV
ncbi:tyrosine-type recombinase/integrase [Asinibacterium sp. OR53]|uniref:tyrosine-type recombinase/integrase n=1 Tax=Asinibacterium sp. OR53 TaxID=925409 RepID=UPI00047BAFDD|nr:tyrosine-type recombinase/integrase [Asinibacterium sp. OR53]